MSFNFNFPRFFNIVLNLYRRLTVWLSGSGGSGETRMNDCTNSRKPRSAKKRRSRCPLQLMFGGLLLKGIWWLSIDGQSAWVNSDALHPLHVNQLLYHVLAYRPATKHSFSSDNLALVS